jgi:hypothetical protein
LCFNCDEKFAPGRKCKRLFLIDGCYEEDDPPDDPDDFAFNPEEGIPKISLHAITGAPVLQTMRIKGEIQHHKLILLVDFSSTYNFINELWAERMGITPTSLVTFEVVVANGEKIAIKGICKGFVYTCKV